jgi:hypothetical protein
MLRRAGLIEIATSRGSAAAAMNLETGTAVRVVPAQGEGAG